MILAASQYGTKMTNGKVWATDGVSVAHYRFWRLATVLLTSWQRWRRVGVKCVFSAR